MAHKEIQVIFRDAEQFHLDAVTFVKIGLVHDANGNRNVVVQHFRTVEIITSIALHLEQLKQFGRTILETAAIKIQLHVIHNLGV